MHRRLRLIGILLGLSLASYFIGSFIFLNFYLEKEIGGSPESLRFEYRYAYSLLPGRVFLRGVKCRIQDSNIQMHFEMPKAQVSISLSPLRNRTLELTRVRADQLKFHLRFRRTEKELKTVSLSALPTIPGLDSLLKPPPKPRGPFNPWKLDIQNIAVRSIDELWIEEFRFQGSASLRGGFYLHPKTKVEVYPTRIGFRNGDITIASAPLVEEMGGDIYAEIERFDPDSIPGLDIFKHVTAKIGLKTKIGGVAFLNYYLRGRPAVSFVGGSGTGETAIELRKGELQPGSRLDLDTSELEGIFWNQRAKGRGRVAWTVADTGKSELAVRLADFSLSHRNRPQYLIRGKELAASFHSDRFRVNAPLEHLDWNLDTKNATITDLRYLNTYLPRGSHVLFDGGKGNVSVHLETNLSKRNDDNGKLNLAAKDASFQMGQRAFRGDLEISATVKQSDLERGLVRMPSSVLQVKQLTLKGPLAGLLKESWSGRLEFHDSTLNLDDETKVSTNFTLTANNAGPVVALLAHDEGGIPQWLPHFVSLKDFTGSGRAQIDGNFVKVSDIDVKAESAEFEGWFKKVPAKPVETRFFAAAGPFSIAYEQIEGNSRLRLHEAKQWFQRREKNPMID